MFHRVECKKAAKAQLKGRWKIPVLSTLLIFALLAVMSASVAAIFADKINIHVDAGAGALRFGVHGPKESGPFSILIGLVMAAMVLAQKRLLYVMSKNPEPIYFSDYVDGLSQWWQAIRGIIWKSVWVWLWSLLFVIPGIVKWYAYSMMSYVMAEYPEMSARKAMNISKELTRGYKGDLFVTDLTFIPLAILCVLSFGIGSLWAFPYYQATYTNIYRELKRLALDSKRLSMEDFKQEK